jgi:Flp pilus assembly protein TadD
LVGTLFAERVLQGSIWLDSTSGEPHAILGKVLMAKGQLAQAERTLQRAIAVDTATTRRIISSDSFTGK